MDFAIISVSNRTEKSKLTIAARIQHLRKAKGASQEEMKFFENARTVEKRYTIKINVCVCVVMLGLGAFLGAFSKYLDIYQTDLPGWLMKIDTLLDLHNFLGEFSPWIIIAVAIALYSVTPICAAVNVCVFFSGIITSYYLYSSYVGGFFSRSYAMIWVALTIISPFLAYLCWFAKSDNWFSVLLSSEIIGFLLNLFAQPCTTEQIEQCYICTESQAYKARKERERNWRQIESSESKEFLKELRKEEIGNIIDEMEEVVYVSDVDTYELYYLNTAGQRLTGGYDYKGEKCYKILQGRNKP